MGRRRERRVYEYARIPGVLVRTIAHRRVDARDDRQPSIDDESIHRGNANRRTASKKVDKIASPSIRRFARAVTPPRTRTFRANANERTRRDRTHRRRRDATTTTTTTTTHTRREQKRCKN